jgi:DNA-binding NtrC family response regulator
MSELPPDEPSIAAAGAAEAWADSGWAKAVAEFHQSRGQNTFAVTLAPATPSPAQRRCASSLEQGRARMIEPPKPGNPEKSSNVQAREGTEAVMTAATPARLVYNMDGAAERLGVSRRTLQDWLKAHPVDGRGEPFPR